MVDNPLAARRGESRVVEDLPSAPKEESPGAQGALPALPEVERAGAWRDLGALVGSTAAALPTRNNVVSSCPPANRSLA